MPVLVDGAVMPGKEDLPDGLTRLSRLQALSMNDVSWNEDFARLIKALDQVLTPLPPTDNVPQQQEVRLEPNGKRAGLWLKIGAMALLLGIIVSLAIWQLIPNKSQTKSVILMDSFAPATVYDTDTRDNLHFTNEYDLYNVLAPLQHLAITHNIVGQGWNQHESIRQQNPDLIIIHWSAFYGVTITIDGATSKDEDINFIQFIKYMEGTKAKFLVYTRSDLVITAQGRQRWFAYMEEKLPGFTGLKDRLHLFTFREGRPLTFRDGVAVQDLRQQVKEILQLE
jgi:hypothetical protein